jgi:hypothetical protein
LHWNDLGNATRDPILGEYFGRLHLETQPFDSKTSGKSEYLFNYLKGWKQGVEQLWEEVREKL